MGTVMAIMGIIGGASMLGNIGTAGYKGVVSTDNLRKQISEVQNQTRQWTNKYNELGKAGVTIDQDFIDATTNSLEKYNQLQAEIKSESDNFSKQYKILQETGVILLSVVFFLLVLKQLDLFGPLWHVITIPERYIIQKIKKK